MHAPGRLKSKLGTLKRQGTLFCMDLSKYAEAKRKTTSEEVVLAHTVQSAELTI